MNIDVNNPLPLYYQLREEMRKKILDGEWQYGQEVPSETQLCKDLNVSRSTVKQALDGLVAEGLIIRKRGKGTFVNYKKLFYKMMEEPNFYVQMENEGAEQKSVVLDSKYIAADEKVSNFLDIPLGTQVAYFKRIRYIDNVPMIVQTVYILKEYECELMQNDLTSISFHNYIEEKNGFILNHFDINISSIILNQEYLAYFLCDKPISGFHFDTVYQSEGKKIIYNERIFRGDMINLLLSYDYYKHSKSKKEFRIINNDIE